MLIKNIQKPNNYKAFASTKKDWQETHYDNTCDFENNIECPKTLGDKMTYCVMNFKYNNKLFRKDTAKDEVIKILGTDEYIIPTYQICNSIDEINYDNLVGKSFVIKPANAALRHGIIKQKIKLKKKDIKQLKEQISTNKYLVAGKIVIEKYIKGSNAKVIIKDYKFWCFNGKPTFLLIVKETQDGQRLMKYYDITFKKTINIYKTNDHIYDSRHKKPKNFDKMVEIASKISQGMPVVRVDLYNVNGKIYFGECQKIYSYHCNFVDQRKNKELSYLIDFSKVSKEMLNLPNRQYEVKIGQNTNEAKELLNANDENFEFCFAKSQLPLYYKTGDKDFIYKKNGLWHKQEYFTDKDGKQTFTTKIYNKRTKTFEPLMTRAASKILYNILTKKVKYKYDEEGDIVYYNKYNDSVCVKCVKGEWIKNEYETIKVKKASSQSQIYDEEKQKWIDKKDNVLQFNKIAG